MASEAQASQKVSFRQRRNVTLTGLSLGHGVKHWYNSAFWVLFPLIKEEFLLGPISASFLITARQTIGGLSNFAIGPLSDMFRTRWHILIPSSFLAMAICYMLIGLAPGYAVIAILLAVSGLFTNIWHPPAIAILSNQFPERKGLALSFHGGGAGAGETLAPLGAGFILTFMVWRDYLTFSIIPAVVVALLLYWVLAGMKMRFGERAKGQVYWQGAKMLLKNVSFLMLALASGVRALGHFALLTFLSLYLSEDIGLGTVGVGAHIMLLTLLGVVLGPFIGHISDRIGRKPVLVVGLGTIGVGSLLLALFGTGWQLVAIIALIGIFLFSLQDIINAAAMDQSQEGLEGTAIGFLFGSNFVFGGASPVIAGLLVNATGTNVTAFYYVAIVLTLSAVLMALVPMRKPVVEQA
jgi:MFS transporter, FSR family, fosmidomycin resistance protein